MKTLTAKLTIAAVLIAIAFRLFFFGFTLRHLPLSSDEAWPSLMAMHMLKGEFPIVYWGQTYMGTQESVFDAALIAIMGPHKFTIRLYPLMFSFLFLFFSWVLARKIYNREVGRIVLALLAIPVPYLSMCGALVPPDDYLAMTTLGSMSLVVLYDLIYGNSDGRRLRRFVLLGFLLGFTFYLHILVLSYIGVALLFIFLKDKLFFIRKEFWAGVAAFAVGSFPLIWYNAMNHLATFTDVGRTTDLRSSWELCRLLFMATLDFLTGTKIMLYPDGPHYVSLPAALAMAVGIIWIVALLVAAVDRFKPLLRLATFSTRGTDGTAILVALAVAAMFMFCRSSRSGWDNVRYVLPVISALPILFAYGLWRIKQKSVIVFAVLLAVVVAAQAWGNVLLARQWTNPKTVAVDLELPDTRPLLRFLDQHGIRYAYAHYWISYRITYETAERLICSEPFNERFSGREVKFLDQVSAATNIAYITHPTLKFVGDFESLLKGIGGSYRKEEVGDFTVYYDFKPPYAASPSAQTPLTEIARDQWTVTSDPNPAGAALAIDGHLDTRWGSGHPQAPGMHFDVDLGQTRTVSAVRFDLARWASDYPRGYRILLSSDDKAWRQVCEVGDLSGLGWQGAHPQFFMNQGFFVADFAPTEARHVRIELTGSHPRLDWSIAELRMYAPKADTP